MRHTFGMKRLEHIPKYNEYKKYERQRKTNEAQRREVAEFTLAAMEGNYDAVYLTEVKRTIDGDAQSDNFVKNLIPRCRYGRTTQQDILNIKQEFASEAEFEADEKFKDARVAEALHFFATDEPTRKTVESENIRRTFAFAEKNKKPVVCLKAAHMPLEKASSLAQASGKQFEGMLSHFVACEGMPIMILSNLAPQFGLFNGATCTFKGLL